MGVVISLVGIAVTSVIALLIAYMQRSQMRQIEAHKSDPSVPLKPPPHRIWAWLRNNVSVFIIFGTGISFEALNFNGLPKNNGELLLIILSSSLAAIVVSLEFSAKIVALMSDQNQINRNQLDQIKFLWAEITRMKAAQTLDVSRQSPTMKVINPNQSKTWQAQVESGQAPDDPSI